MSIHQLMFANYEHPRIVCDAADFDGTNDYMLRGAGLTGAADSKTGIFSCWLRLDGGNDALQRIMSSVLAGDQGFRVSKTAANIFQITGEDTSGLTKLILSPAATFTAGTTWRHFLVSWDLAAAASHLYVNDSSDNDTPTTTDATLDYTVDDWSIGAHTAGTALVNGAIAELYFAPGQYLDFSLVYNRRKFISASGKPVHLGTTGALPTGTAPLVYQHLDDSEAVANFAANAGTGGNFTITGTLDTADSSPSD